jgi:hypothetical protein
MTMLYGNLADAALGDRRFAQDACQRLKTVAERTAALTPRWRPKPATRLSIGLGLAVIGFSALVILGEAPDRFAAATPAIADLEAWLIWGDLKSF